MRALTPDQLPSIHLLRERFIYDPETGAIYWAPGTKNEGKRADTAHLRAGYATISFSKKRRILAHRAAWAIATGAWPTADIDHINGQKADNRLANLREATRQQNLRNHAAQKRNKTGYRGVSWCKQTNGYRASIVIHGKYTHLGSFPTPEAARDAYVAKAKELHGEFFHPG